ncbi:probable arginine--tRNA ligase, mitochondrial [Argiope bruennichi]|uniref:probable arginine--tRNA ligase, mitochondrial n=1 Tax=Argiope bruennichi TaxID=94029 RepID=UPI002494A677|nr:probable arginine--tRNA ligase, mitochondrial [Argiope bruennichi]
MASFFRWRIANKVIPLLSESAPFEKCINPSAISSFVRVNKFKSEQPQLFLPWKPLTNALPEINSLRSPNEVVKLLRNQGLPTAEGFVDIALCQQPLSVVFTVDKYVFSKIILTDICANDEIIAKSSCLFQDISPKKVLIECWSPKIGEIFKMSHFKSGIHSNFIANINKVAGHDVIKIAHIGDWGLESAATLLKFHELNEKEHSDDVKADQLFKISRSAKLQFENDINFKNNVKSYFEKMRKDDKDLVSEWNGLKDLYMKHYTSIYEKIGLTFDDTLFDSSYSAEIEETCKVLLEKNLVTILDDGKVKINIDAERTENIFSDNEMDPFINRLGRSIFAASHWRKKHNFDIMYYVAPTSENNFFSLLFPVIKKFGIEWSNTLHHIKLKNISHFDKKRKNKGAEFFMNQAKQFTIDMLKKDLHMPEEEITNEMAEVLSITSLIVNDMMHKRSTDYDFSWKDILSLSKKSGASLQFCHAGLKGLQEDSEFIFKVEIDTSPLTENVAHNLIKHLSRFDEEVYSSYLTLEPRILLEYLFSLWYYIDKATNVLKLDIKDDRLIVIKARLMLLEAARKTLQRGLHLLGITPYETNYTPPDFIKE